MGVRSGRGAAADGPIMIDRNLIDSKVDALARDVIGVATKIHEHPELRFEEHRAASWLAETIEAKTGVAVERGIGDLPTAFRARITNGPGPHVAILAEYDALPEIGHACGHNLIAGGALAAFLALSAERERLPGTTVVSIGHRSTLTAFHDRRIEMTGAGDGLFSPKDKVLETAGAE